MMMHIIFLHKVFRMLFLFWDEGTVVRTSVQQIDHTSSAAYSVHTGRPKKVNIPVKFSQPVQKRMNKFQYKYIIIKYRVAPKNWHIFVRLNFMCLNFIKYWPIFKLVSLPE